MTPPHDRLVSPVVSGLTKLERVNKYYDLDLTRMKSPPQRIHVSATMNLKDYLEFQNREIERHKWIESEKAGKDLGKDAVIDWILKYADVFSDNYIRERKTATEE
jgi:hypothetical protein